MGFGHTAKGIQQLCMELTAIIHANFHVAATIEPDRRHSSLYSDFDDHYEAMINTKSIELAVNLRSLFDRCTALANPRKVKQAEQESKAIRFIEGDGPETLRECTNKIIHAGYFLFEYERYESTGQNGERFSNEVQSSVIKLSGWHFRRKWLCTLDLLKFCEEAHAAAQELEQEFQQ